MVFGIDKELFKYFLNPYLLYIRFKKNKLLKKYQEKFLIIQDFTTIYNSKLGNHISLGYKVTLNNSKLGNHTYVNSKTIINNATIGKFCSIASHVKFGLGAHPTDLISTHPAFYSNNHIFKTFADKMYFHKNTSIHLGNDVWIGESAVIMAGINIGDGAIIAAGAIVTKDVRPYEVVGGVPAKHIKYRFSEEEIINLLQIKWWDQNEKWFEENYKIFLEKDKFFSYFYKK